MYRRFKIQVLEHSQFRNLFFLVFLCETKQNQKQITPKKKQKQKR